MIAGLLCLELGRFWVDIISALGLMASGMGFVLVQELYHGRCAAGTRFPMMISFGGQRFRPPHLETNNPQP